MVPEEEHAQKADAPSRQGVPASGGALTSEDSGTSPEQPRIRLLGPPALDLAASVSHPLSPKDAALLAKLALDGPQPRGVLCGLLWPESSEKQAAQNLRQRSTQLGRLSGGRLLVLGASVSLEPSLAVDVKSLHAINGYELLVAGELLAGCDFGAYDELDRWVQQARLRMATECAELLASHAEGLESAGRLHEALRYARRVAELAPMSEHGVRRLMRLHYLRRDRAAAREAYLRFAGGLNDEQGRLPVEETRQLMQTIELEESRQNARRRPVPPSVLRPPVLVGRDAEWSEMALAWKRDRPFILIGEGGIGKTRLLEEFSRHSKGSVVVTASLGDVDAPLALLGRLLVEVEQRHAAPISPEARLELARIRPEFGTAPRSPPNVYVIRHAVEQMLLAATRQGLKAVLLDDVHRADVASMELLRWLVSRADLTHLRWGLAARPNGGALSAWTNAAERPVPIDLRRLEPKELVTLLASLALPTLVDTDLAAQLYRHAGGHPFYTLATLQDALSQGANLRDPALPRPDSVHVLLDERLRELPEPALRVLRVAAIAGPDLRVDRVARVLDCAVMDLAGPWALLESAGILSGEAFAHELLNDSALRAVPQGMQQALHRRFAQVLMQDQAARPSDIARHFEDGQAWPEAAAHWTEAAYAARRRACLAEQIDLFERAARCFALAGDTGGRCDALLGRLDGLQRRLGGNSVLEALAEVDVLADSSLRRLRCRLLRAEAWIDAEQTQGLAEAETAVRESALHPELLAEAFALQAQALAQQGRYAAARQAGEHALEAAQAHGDDAQRLSALHAQAYVCYADGRLAEALVWQVKGVELAEHIGFRAESAAGEGHVAALLASIGDVPGTHTQALRAQDSHRAVGMSNESTFGIVNRIVLGVAAAALGRFNESLTALRDAVHDAERSAAPAAQAKAGLALASVWLTLGRTEDALNVLDELSPALGPGMQMQALLLRARAAEQAGLSPQRHLAALGEVDRKYHGLPLVMSAHFESSYQGDASEMIERLSAVRAECLEKGLTGTARSMQWRTLVRLLDRPGETLLQAALEHARDLNSHVENGLSAKCYVPQVWATLAVAYARCGLGSEHAACGAAARSWIERTASRVPPPLRDGFLKVNRYNRLILSGEEAGVPGAL